MGRVKWFLLKIISYDKNEIIRQKSYTDRVPITLQEGKQMKSFIVYELALSVLEDEYNT